MTIDRSQLAPGPIALVDIPAVLGRAPGASIESFVAERVDDIAGAHDRIDRNLRVMADDLDGADELATDGDLDAALAEHAGQLLVPDPDFAADAARAQRGSDALATFAGELPPDDTLPFDESISLEGDGFDGITVDYDAIGRPAPTPGGGVPGGGGGVPPPEPTPEPTPPPEEVPPPPPPPEEPPPIDGGPTPGEPPPEAFPGNEDKPGSRQPE